MYIVHPDNVQNNAVKITPHLFGKVGDVLGTAKFEG